MSSASAKKKAVTEEILCWLERNYELSDGVCLPRSLLYKHYSKHCASKHSEPIGAAAFGKMVRKRFSEITTRRLGTRGQSKYHYYGLGIKATSEYYNSNNCGNGIAFVPSPSDSSVSSVSHSHFMQSNSTINGAKCCDPSYEVSYTSTMNSLSNSSHAMSSSGLHLHNPPCMDMSHLNSPKLLPSFHSVFQDSNELQLNSNDDHSVSVNTSEEHDSPVNTLTGGASTSSVRKRERDSLIFLNDTHVNSMSRSNECSDHLGPVLARKNGQEHSETSPRETSQREFVHPSSDHTPVTPRATFCDDAKMIFNHAFPLHHNLLVPHGVSSCDLNKFLTIYRDHCLHLIDLLTCDKLLQIQSDIAAFWPAVALDLSHLVESPFFISLLECCEVIFYDALELVLVNPSVSSDKSIQDFIKGYPHWLESAILSLPSPVYNTLKATADDFIHVIQCELKLIPLIKSCALILSDASRRKNMAEINNINFKMIDDELRTLSFSSGCIRVTKSLIQFVTGAISSDSSFTTSSREEEEADYGRSGYTGEEYCYQVAGHEMTGTNSSHTSSQASFCTSTSPTTALVMDALALNYDCVESAYGNKSTCTSIRHLNNTIWFQFHTFMHSNDQVSEVNNLSTCTPLSTTQNIDCNGPCDRRHGTNFSNAIALMRKRGNSLIFAIERSLHILTKEMILSGLKSIGCWQLVMLFINDLSSLITNSIIRKEMHQIKLSRISRRCYQPEIDPYTKDKEYMMQLL